MKKRILVLLVCLAACALIFQTLPHSIQATTSPTAKGMTEFALKALTEKWGYIYGTYGSMATSSLVAVKIAQYPAVFSEIMTDGFSAAVNAREWIGHRVADCAGLVKAYLWWKSDDSGPAYNSAQDYSANSIYHLSAIKGPISTIPNTHGLLVWRDGHMGIYIGNGEVIEARGVEYGVVKTRLRDRNWTSWCRSPFVTYPTTGWQVIDSQQYYYLDGVYLTGPQVVEGQQVLFGSDGARLTGFQEVAGKVIYYSPDGARLTGWQTTGGERFFFDASSSPLTGWQTIDGKTCLFGTDGVLLTGWQERDEFMFWLDSQGVPVTGAVTIADRNLAFDAAGHLLTGWQGEGAARTWRSRSGLLIAGLQFVGDGIYLFKDTGELLTGLQTVGGKDMFFDPATGKRAGSGLLSIDGASRLVLDDGTLAVAGQWLLSGSDSYLAGESGNPVTGSQAVSFFAADLSEQQLSLSFDSVSGALLPASQDGWQIGPDSPILQVSPAADAVGTIQLAAAGSLPADGRWLTLDPTIAIVDASGLVTGVSSGRTLVALADLTGAYALVRVTVLPAVSSLALAAEAVDLEPGMAAALPVVGLPAALMSGFHLTSSNTEVAAVLTDGRQIANQTGSSRISLMQGDNSILSWAVNVAEPIVGISAARSSITLPVGGRSPVVFRTVPAGATGPALTVTSSNPAVAAVDAQGRVYGLSAGATVLTASAGSFTASCTILVDGQLIRLKNGSVGEPVRQIQQALADLGYLGGPVDGVYRSMTEFAVASLQRNMQLEPTGQADSALQKLLLNGQAEQASPLAAAGQIRNGDDGEQVLTLQNRLFELNYFKGQPDGHYGELTIRAVTTFQVLNGLTLSGMAGAAEIALLYDAAAVPADATLTLNDTGYEVSQLQTRLAGLNFYAGSVDGVFSTAVEAAVRSFQGQTGLSVDGKAGYRTQSRLYAADAPVKTGIAAPAATVAPVPSPTTAPAATPAPVPTLAPAPEPTATPTPATPQPAELNESSRGTGVTSLEVRVVELGYHLDVADDTYDGLTAASIRSFQQRSGLAATGIADLITQNRLASGTARRSAISYRRGSVGDGVARIQRRLAALGLLGGQADGRFGPVTDTAARGFQRKYGLTVDGIVGPQSIARLFYSETGAPALSGGSGQTVSAGTTGTTTTVAGVSAGSTAGDLTAPVLTVNLRRGSRGTAVMQVQLRLIQLGYLPQGSADGSFGPMTDAAVRAFQRKASLVVDGIIGSHTISKLYTSSAPHA